jgi:cell division protein FtsI (penicillin-binding protein 3)
LRSAHVAYADAGHQGFARAQEAAPARNRVRFLALTVFAVLAIFAVRAVQLAFAGDPLARPRGAVVASVARADIVDRNGVLLVTTVRAYALTVEPARVRNPQAVADAVRQILPNLDRATLVRRLTDRSRDLAYLARSLSEEQRAQIEALNLQGIGFENQDRRSYPHGTLAAHAMGFTDVDLNPLAGVERGLDDDIREAGASGRHVRLTLDVRMQYALETELDVAARAAGASGAAGVLLDGRSGEVLALASWPAFDPNAAGRAPEDARRDRVAGDVHELGSTIKPFTIAMALQEEEVTSRELFDLNQRFEIDGAPIVDEHPIEGLATLRDIIAHSSNIGAARLAVRVGGARQRAYLERLGLTTPTRLEMGRNEAPLAPRPRGRRDVAAVGFGYGLAATPVALAGAYTVFANGGARVEPTLVPRAPEDEVDRVAVFSPQTMHQVLSYLRSVVTEGTGRAAEVPGLEVAGKTGTAEKPGGAQGYDDSRNFSSFAGVFPARDPRYVIVVALDDTGEGAAGGMVAAPVVARTLRRIAPMLETGVSAAQ